jgi:hypothetical protein
VSGPQEGNKRRTDVTPSLWGVRIYSRIQKDHVMLFFGESLTIQGHNKPHPNPIKQKQQKKGKEEAHRARIERKNK